MKKILISILVASAFIVPVATVFAQELYQDIQGFWKAKVLDVISEEVRIVPGTDTQSTYQKLRIEILEGEKKGQILELENDLLKLRKGDIFFLNYLISIGGAESYSVRDIERRPTILFFGILFVAVILLFGGKQGLRSLLSLAGSLLIIMYVLLPGLLKGYPPVLTSAIIATFILFLAIYLTHGFNKESHAAFLGTVTSVIVTSVLAYFAVSATRLSGFGSDEAVYLNMSTRGALDMTGLLLGAIIIGVLGVLDDIAVTQATVVRELYGNAPHMTKYEIYTSALRVGKEHVGALVNTLALAYTGASLPLLLIFTNTDNPSSMVLNYEVFATEIIRTIVGSIGLILTVPVTTALAVWMLKDTKGKAVVHEHTHVHHHH
jgi:uncharacterized membrane protein